MTSQQNLNASAENRGILAQRLSTDASSVPHNPILITIDLEDWFQVERLCPVYPRHTWDVCDLRVKMNTRILLDLLDHYQVRATFFVLGWVAERCPDLIREIHNRGHEIACHGYDHRRCSDMSAKDLRDDLYKSKAILSDIVAYPVIGYRAPGFSVTQRLIEILRELNFVYDSSYDSTISNKRHRRLPDDTWHRSSSGHLIYRNGIIELPVSNFKFVGKVLPWGGGKDLRLWPTPVFKWGIRQILKREGYYVFYMHPWEIDFIQPKAKELPFHSRAWHYLHLSGTLHRVSHLLSTFQTTHVFMSCRQYINA